jgi:predicted  nucleic acid-binding Zn-ribbon protein
VAKSPTEHIRELSVEIRAITERESALRDQFTDLKERDEKREKENAELRRELTDVRQENAVLRQQLQDHIKQTDLADNRRWALIVLLLGAVLSLASGLIVTLAKK